MSERLDNVGRTVLRRGSAATAALALVAAALATASRSDAAAPQDQEGRDEFRPRAFQLYDTQAARARAEEALEHIEAARWSEALTELQALIEEHRGEVLGSSRPQVAGAPYPSQSDVHAGAGSWAVQQLFLLPEEGRELYRDRFGRSASRAVQRAIASADRGRLARVAQRWPLTSAAERAWWALGDLEIELGHSGDGLRAWARAAALRVGDPLRTTTTEADWAALEAALSETGDGASGAVARARMARALLPEIGGEDGSQPKAEASFTHGPATGIAAAAITTSRSNDSQGTAGWPVKFRLPQTPYSRASGASRLFPQRAGDIVLVNTSRSVHALDAFDGTEIWNLPPEVLGWGRGLSSRRASDFDKAVDDEERIVTVAVNRGVVVAPVQIPWSYENSDQYNDLSIIEVIPERRLVALDVETGEPLWNTLPPYDWDGDSGSFADRMTVVGPPTIVGARVLVPMARLRGRIEMHLGCFDLATGDVLWSAPIVTGQRTLNMFGRANVEFSAPPPVVSGDTIIVATQLGLVAAIDLFTGETRWNTLYEQVPILPPQYYTAGYMANRWRNAPPVVVEDTVVVAPFDGKELFALDAASGSMLWSMDQKSITKAAGVVSTFGSRGRSGGLEVLLGADDRRIYLGGTAVAAMELMRGVRGGPPMQRAWAWPIETVLDQNGGFPAIDAKSVFIPDKKGVTVIDRETGAFREHVSGETIGRGHLLVADGMLFAANGNVVDARFEWVAMVERARLAVRSDSATASDLDTLVRLLLERAETMLDRGSDVTRALALTREAERSIEEFGRSEAADEASLVSGSTARARRDEQSHRALMLRVRGERLRGDADAARRAATAALELNPPRHLALETLLSLHEIERARDPAARAEILSTMLERHGEAKIEVEARVQGGRWSPTVALAVVRDAVRRTGQGGSGLVRDSLWVDPWDGPIVPTAASLTPRGSGGRDAADKRTANISIELFALLGQIELARRTPDREFAMSAELFGLHSILAEVPMEPLFGTISGDWAAARVKALRALEPDSKALADIDAEAGRMLERAKVAAETIGSTSLLEKLPALYPGSGAAQSAAEARIEYALRNGSPREVAAIVGDALSADWRPDLSTPRETVLLLRLAETLGEAGNVELMAGIVANLARYQPDTVVDLPGTGEVRLGDLRERWAAAPAPTARPTFEFDASVAVRDSISGNFMPVERGAVPTAGGATREMFFAATSNMLCALESGRSGEPVWTRPTTLGGVPGERYQRVVLRRDRLVVAESGRVVCLDAATSNELWSFSRKGRKISRIAVSDGVVVVVTARTDNSETGEVHGLDEVLGAPLWKLGSIENLYHSVVKVGDGRMVLLPRRGAEAAVHDLYTGYPVVKISTGPINPREAKTSWIDRGRLVIPFIEGGHSAQRRNEIVANSLDDGRESWRVDLDDHAGARHNLAGLIEMPSSDADGETVRLAMLELVEDDGRSSLGSTEMTLHVLDERLGALNRRPLVRLDRTTHLVGVGDRQRTVIDTPILVTVQQGQDERMPVVQAIDPRRGVLWKQTASRRINAIGVQRLAAPVVGDGVVAILVAESFGGRSSRSSETKLMFLDAATGRTVATRLLESGTTSGRWRDLAGIGSTLVVMGGNQMDVLE